MFLEIRIEIFCICCDAKITHGKAFKQRKQEGFLKNGLYFVFFSFVRAYSITSFFNQDSSLVLFSIERNYMLQGSYTGYLNMSKFSRHQNQVYPIMFLSSIIIDSYTLDNFIAFFEIEMGSFQLVCFIPKFFWFM